MGRTKWFKRMPRRGPSIDRQSPRMAGCYDSPTHQRTLRTHIPAVCRTGRKWQEKCYQDRRLGAFWVCTIFRWHIDKPIRSPKCWGWSCNDLKIPRLMITLISHAHCMIRVGACTPPLISMLHLSDIPYRSAPQDEVARRVNRLRSSVTAESDEYYWTLSLCLRLNAEVQVLWT